MEFGFTVSFCGSSLLLCLGSSVFGLCIPVTEESLDDKMSRSLLKYAIYSLDLVEENIFLWQITGLNEIQIISIILQFSRYLRSVVCICILYIYELDVLKAKFAYAISTSSY